MYFSNKIEPRIARTSNCIMRALRNKNYIITYYFDDITEKMIYEASLKNNVSIYCDNEEIPIYIKTEILPTGIYKEISIYETSYSTDYEGNLYRYLRDKEELLTDEELKKIYGPTYDAVNSLRSMPIEKLKKRSEARCKINELIEKIKVQAIHEAEKKQNGKETKKIKKIILDPIFEKDETACYLSLKIHEEGGQSYAVRNIDKLIYNITNHVTDKYSTKLKFEHDISKFDEASQELIKIFSSQSSADNEYQYYERRLVSKLKVTPLAFVLMISKCVGKKITYNDEKYQVGAKIYNFDIVLNNDGTIKTQLDLSDCSLFYNNQFLLQIKKNEILVYKFNNLVQYHLINFIVDNPNFDYSLVQELVKDKLYPMLENKVKVDDSFTNNSSLDIQFSVDFNKSDELVVETKYVIENKMVEKKSIANDPSYLLKVKSFELALKDLNVLENESISDQDKIINFLKSDFSEIREYATVLLSDAIKKLTMKKVQTAKVSIRHNINLLEFDIQFDNLDKEYYQTILNAYRLKKKFIKLKDDFIILDENVMEPVSQLQKDYELDNELNTTGEIPLYQLMNLSSYKSDNINVDYDDYIKNVLTELQDYKESKLTIPQELQSVLRNYQKDGVKWLQALKKYHLAGILADDMGLGKTLEMIAFLATFTNKKPSLIVCPKSLLYNWELEFKKWNPTQQVKVIVGARDVRYNTLESIDEKENVVYITSYDSLRNDIKLYETINFNCVVLDEAQFIKNIYALKTKAVKKINAEYRYVMTGTPIENSLTDLWSIFDFIMPNYLHTYDRFRKDYENSIMEGSDFDKQRLFVKISPFILKRNKKDVLTELPPKEEVIYPLVMKDSQMTLYQAMKIKAQDMLESGDKISILSMLTRLRQICLDPSMFIENYEDISEKLEVAISLIQDAIANNHKVLLFSSFTKCLEHLSELLQEENLTPLYIHGGVPAQERLDLAEKFNTDEESKIMLVSLKAGGTGLNLVGADIVIHLDPWWNLAAENQATDRAHRIGQKNPVMVIKLICKDSIEEKVIELQNLKKDLQDTFLKGQDSSIEINDETLRYILS